ESVTAVYSKRLAVGWCEFVEFVRIDRQGAYFDRASAALSAPEDRISARVDAAGNLVTVNEVAPDDCGSNERGTHYNGNGSDQRTSPAFAARPGAGRVIAREHRAQHAPRIPREGVLFREPPDMAGGP